MTISILKLKRKAIKYHSMADKSNNAVLKTYYRWMAIEILYSIDNLLISAGRPLTRTSKPK